MHYVAEGDPAATTVLILHGEPAWSFMFRRTIPVLADAGLRVIVPDLIGFGRSDKPSQQADYSYESHVRWLTEFVTTLGLRDAILVGHDWGGLLGLRLVTGIDGLARGYVASNHGYPTGDAPPERRPARVAGVRRDHRPSSRCRRSSPGPASALPAETLRATTRPTRTRPTRPVRASSPR